MIATTVATPKNTQAIRQIQKKAVKVAGDNPEVQLLITKLANAAIGGLAKGCIEADRVKQLEATLATQAEVKSTQKRTLHTSHAIGGEALLKKLLATKSGGGSPSVITTPPRKRTAPHYPQKRVTFSQYRGKHIEQSPIASCSPTSLKSFSTLDEFSPSEDDDEKSSIASTIYLGTPRTSQLDSTGSRPPTPTPAPRKKSYISSNRQGTQRQSERLRRK